jgi:hypothetical protein
LIYSISQEHLDEYMPKVKGVTYHAFKYEHLNNFEGLSDDTAFQVSQHDRKRRVVYQSQCGPCITAMYNNIPIAIFGTVIIWDGLGEAWSLFSEKARRYPIAMTKGANTFFDICEILFSLHRIQITVRSTDRRAVSWARCLGFKSEGLLKEYSTDKTDYYIMRRS